MKWNKVYVSKKTTEYKLGYGVQHTRVLEGTLPDLEKKVMVRVKEGDYTDYYVDKLVDYGGIVDFEDTKSDVIYWCELGD